ncbi:hypothetical protein NPIL_170941 [Nephila pilipes]|uniref:Uncharacterized protein n=1 Tax=Nephila pilipes TaxID=299642 RepID=A0A8X6TSW4_NEPPI|nr:hypothetical protein NPIL_170941 [Nephila pilipes]
MVSWAHCPNYPKPPKCSSRNIKTFTSNKTISHIRKHLIMLLAHRRGHINPANQKPLRKTRPVHVEILHPATTNRITNKAKVLLNLLIYF